MCVCVFYGCNGGYFMANALNDAMTWVWIVHEHRLHSVQSTVVRYVVLICGCVIPMFVVGILIDANTDSNDSGLKYHVDLPMLWATTCVCAGLFLECTVG